MREILFRGKDPETGVWHEGQYIHLHKTTYCFSGGEERDAENEIHQIVFEQMTDWNLLNRHLRADVLPETVGQFTGLTDKNGERIFEGDIVRRFVNEKELRGVVEYADGAFGVRFTDGAGQFICFFDCGEVIGNIHDNPELQKESEGKE